MAELTVEHVTVRFGGVLALDDVGLHVPGGSVTGLIGPNGAGKTTFFDVVTGLRRPETGRVLLDGADVTTVPPHRRARLGISRTFQRLELFGSLTARENVQIAAEARRRSSKRAARRASGILERVGLGDVAEVPADLLPTGTARLLELGRALAADPRVLLLDEPSAGLSPEETAALGELLRALVGEGIGVLLVEHDMSLVMGVCEHVVVLDAGTVIAYGTPAEVQGDAGVQQAYLGRAEDPGPAVHRSAEPPARPSVSVGSPPALLELREVHAGYGGIEVVHGVDLAVAPGTVTALLGPNGAGKSTLLKVASGRLAPSSGSVTFEGTDVTGRAPEQLARLGLCTVPEGRAVFPNLTVAENVRMFAARQRALSPADAEARAFERFPPLAARRHQLAGRLSGGEQQMLGLSRALVTGPRLLVLDELSMGLAPIVVEELYELVAALVEREHLSVLVVEQFAQTALAICAHAAVLVGGRIVRRGTPTEVMGTLSADYLGGDVSAGM